MVRFIVTATIALIAISSVAGAAQNVTSSGGTVTANRHACARGYDYICTVKPRRCRCVPQPQ